MSKDINNDNTTNSIWQLSQISMPYPSQNCKCLISHQTTKNPKLFILGGNGIQTYLQYELRDVLGIKTWWHFNLDLTQVMYFHFSKKKA